MLYTHIKHYFRSKLPSFCILHFAFFIGALATACSDAQTLGDAPIDEVAFSSQPTWESEVSALMKLKCANCHQVPHTERTPEGTPEDLDLRLYSQKGEVRGAREIAGFIREGVLEKGLFIGTENEVRKMPLEFSTPLTAEEIKGLKAWVGLGTPETPSDVGSQSKTSVDVTEQELTRGAEIFSLVSSNNRLSCASCHGPEGNLSNFTPSPPAFLGPDLTFSTLTESSLSNKTQQMWNSSSFAGHGDGSFEALLATDQSSLFKYLLSLRASVDISSDSNITSSNDSFSGNQDSSSSTDSGHSLFHQKSSERRLSCASCHGPEGNLSSFTPSPPAFLGPDLAQSSLSGSSLQTKVQQMWDASSYAGYGQGNFGGLSVSQQDALVWYVISLKSASTSDSQNSDNNNANSGNNASTGSNTVRSGKELYQLAGPSQVSCESCHGPDGDPSAVGFTSLDPSSHPLNASKKEGTELHEKLVSMWDFFTVRGSGDFNKLSSEEQENLMNYVASLQTGASSGFSAPHSHADPDSEYTLCINNSIFDFFSDSSDTLSCHAGTGCGTFDVFDEKQATYETRVACLQDCNQKAADDPQISQCDGVEE